MFAALALALTLILSLMLTTRLSLNDRGYARTSPNSDTISTISQATNEPLRGQCKIYIIYLKYILNIRIYAQHICISSTALS